MKKYFLPLFFPLCANAQTTSHIKGVITYYFNKYQGDKPDIGAHIYIVDSSKAVSFSNALNDTFFMVKNLLHLKKSYTESGIVIPGKVFDMLHSYRIYTDADFDSLDRRNAKQDMDLRFGINVETTAVDGNGTFSMSLLPGVYFICIQSNGRRGETHTDLLGQLWLRKIHLSGRDEDVSFNFGLF